MKTLKEMQNFFDKAVTETTNLKDKTENLMSFEAGYIVGLQTAFAFLNFSIDLPKGNNQTTAQKSS